MIPSDSSSARLYKSILDAHYCKRNNDPFAMKMALQETKTIVKHNPDALTHGVKLADMAQKFHHENIEAEICLQGMFKGLLSLPIAWAAYLGLDDIILFFIEFYMSYSKRLRQQELLLQEKALIPTKDDAPILKLTSQRTTNGYLPLHFAAYEGHEQTTTLLLQHDPEAAQVQDVLEMELPLHGASFNGHENVVRQLLQCYSKGAHVPTKTGWLPLHKACRKGHFNVTQMLLQHYPEGVFQCDDHGNLPLHLAASYCHVDVVRILLEQNPCGASKWNTKRDIPLFCAMKLCVFDVIKLLLEVYPTGASLRDKNDKLPIYFASRNGADYHTFRLILEKSEFAGLFEHRNSCQYLRLWQTESTIFDGILDDFEKEEAAYILSAGKEYPILHDAIGAVPLSGIYYIIKSINVNLAIRDANGRTALSVAIEKASRDPVSWEQYYKPVMKLILNRIKRYKPRSKSLDDTYHYTNFPMVPGKYSDVLHEMMDGDGSHALHVAIKHGLPLDGIKMILDVDINALSLEDYRTGLLPFMMAACEGSCQSSTTSCQSLAQREDNDVLTVVHELLLTKPDLLKTAT